MIQPDHVTTLNDYQQAAHGTSNHQQFADSVMHYVYPILGLTGETGELADKVKKYIRNNNLQTENDFAIHVCEADSSGKYLTNKEALIAELGDVFWYLAEFATRLGVSLEDVANYNIKKLYDRKQRGVISSEGDTR